MRPNAASFGVSLALAAVILACSEKHPTVPDEDTTAPVIDQRDPAVIAGLIASNALPPRTLFSAGVLGSNNAITGDVAFVSAAPGTFLGKDSVFVSNLTRSAVVSSAQLVDGGFDPISISAESGDLVALTLVVANGNRPEPLFVKVPPRRPPVVVRTAPQRGRRDVALTVQIEVVFSEPIDQSTVTTSSLSLSDNGKSVEGTIKVSEDGLSAQFIPQNQLTPGATYELNITGAIRDLSGDALAEEPAVTFGTAQEPEHIAFTLAGGSMYMMNADGTNWVRLGNGVAPAWMPDGSLLYVWNDCAQCALLPWIRTPDGNVRPFLPDALSDGWSFYAPSPTVDGSRVAFVRSSNPNNDYPSASNELVILKVSDFSLSIVPLPAGIAPLDIGKPSWSPDQSRLVFSCADKDKLDAGPLNVDLCFVNLDGSQFVRFGTDQQWESEPAWNPKTGVIAFRRWVINVEGDGLDYIDTMDDEDGRGIREYSYGAGPAWSPDGKSLLFCGPPLFAVTNGAQRTVYSDPHMPFLYDLAWGRR